MSWHLTRSGMIILMTALDGHLDPSTWIKSIMVERLGVVFHDFETPGWMGRD